jgi:hypothetical protein
MHEHERPQTLLVVSRNIPLVALMRVFVYFFFGKARRARGAGLMGRNFGAER